jgi:hypothetical protein
MATTDENFIAMDFPLIPAHLFSVILDVVDRGSDYTQLHRTLRLVSKGVCRSLPRPPPTLKGNVFFSADNWKFARVDGTHPPHKYCQTYTSLLTSVDDSDWRTRCGWSWKKPWGLRPCFECGVNRRCLQAVQGEQGYCTECVGKLTHFIDEDVYILV